MNKEVLKKMSEMLAKFREENDITFVTATQPPRPRAHFHHERPIRTGPDVVIVDHMNLIIK